MQLLLNSESSMDGCLYMQLITTFSFFRFTSINVDSNCLEVVPRYYNRVKSSFAQSQFSFTYSKNIKY